MSKIRHSEDRTLRKGDRTGALGSAVPRLAQKRSPRLENCLPSGVVAHPFGASASQCGSYVKEGVRKTNKEALLCTMS